MKSHLVFILPGEAILILSSRVSLVVILHYKKAKDIMDTLYMSDKEAG